MKKLTVIVPRLPPAINGLGDYGLCLARQMYKDFGVETEFIVADPYWKGADSIENFSVKKISAHSSLALLELLPNEGTNYLLLHYVGYGYAKRGCPVWLVKGLESWKKASSQNRLITMFHELYAFGPIWTSQFWTSPLQRNLASHLVRLSNHSVTSKNGYANIIKKFGKDFEMRVPVIPVFSNVGEPMSVLPLKERARTLVVFGGTNWRLKVYKESKALLEKICDDFEIKEIIDIGTPLCNKIDKISRVEWKELGILPSEEISRILSNSVIGFFNYPTEYLCKSGIFAAYCAHGVLPVGIFYPGQKVDGVEENKHYVVVDGISSKLSLADAQAIADNAYQWYQGHKLSIHAKQFLALLD